MKDDFEILKPLGNGAVSDAYLVKNGKVLLVGRREDSFSNYQSLYEKMKYVDGNIHSVNISDGIEMISPCEEFPLGAMLENFVGGEELKNKIGGLNTEEKKNIGKRLAEFVGEMQLINCNFDKDAEIKNNIQKYEKSLTLLKSFINENNFKKLAQIQSIYEEFMRNSDFYLTHGDLQEANILINENNELSGIIDFGNMEYYVPEVEFAAMMGFDDVIFNSMVQNYSKEIEEKNILLVKLVRSVRHFKHDIGKSKNEIDLEIKDIINLANQLSAEQSAFLK